MDAIQIYGGQILKLWHEGISPKQTIPPYTLVEFGFQAVTDVKGVKSDGRRYAKRCNQEPFCIISQAFTQFKTPDDPESGIDYDATVSRAAKKLKAHLERMAQLLESEIKE